MNIRLLGLLVLATSLSAQNRQIVVLDQGTQCISSLSLDAAHRLQTFCDPATPLTDAQALSLAKSGSGAELFIADRELAYQGDAQGEANRVILALPKQEGFLVDLDHDEDFIYWVDHRRGTIFRASKLAPDDHHPLYADSIASLTSIAAASRTNDLFWIDNRGSAIYRGRKDGSEVQLIIDSSVASAPCRLAIDEVARRVYWTEDSTGRINSAAYDGSMVRSDFIESAEAYPYGIYVDALSSMLYWTNYGSGTVRRAPLTGLTLEPETVMTDLVTPLDIAIMPLTGEHLSDQTSDLDAVQFVILPNPIRNTLNLELSDRNNPNPTGTIEVFTADGRLVLQRPMAFSGQRSSLDFSLYPSGVYSAVLTLSGTPLRQKFVKQ